MRVLRMAAAAIFVLAIAACGDDSTSTNSNGNGNGNGGGTPTAFDCPTKASGTPVKVGVLWPEGPAANLPDVGAGSHAAAQYANDCLGGIAGRPIETVDCKIDEANSASATACANKMVEEHVVAVVTGVTGSGSTLVPIITAAGIPYLNIAALAPEENVDTTGFVFTISGGVASALGAMAQEAKDAGISKVGLIVASTVAGQVGQLAQLPFGKLGVQVETIPIDLGSGDATPQLNAALSGGAQATAVIGDGTLCIAYLSATMAVDADGTHYLVSTCTAKPIVEALGEAAFDGALLFGAGDLSGDKPESKLFIDVMHEYAPDVDIEGFGGAGYSIMLSLVRGTENLTGEPTAESIAAALRSTSDVPAPGSDGEVFGCATDPIPVLNALCQSQITVGTISGGKATDLHVIDTAPLFVF